MATSQDTDLQKQIENLKLNNPADINILLLGETGVGKSTFINSIANYLTYTDFKKASKENLLTLIPSKFNIQDKHGNQHIIQTSTNEDKNEYLETGMSATQDVKTYVFPIWGGQTKIRLIDTPGMGDTRGIRQDDINCENILSYIGQLHELHAICFMFKPTNTRLTQFFGYCMSQILSRLDKSASKNIIFVFTNTRGTDYGPGDTFQTLQRVVREIEETPPNVKIPFNRNIFCFDNEVFRYLAATKQNIEFDDSVKERIKESWKKSVDQCWGLIKYIVGDAKNSPLKPHFIKSTSAINEARRLIIQLAQPLAEITQLINDNLFALQRHEQHLNIDNTSLEELRKRLYIPIIDLDITKLTQPATVCASSKCSEIYKVGDKNNWHYKQRCHDPCYLTNVPKEIIGSPELTHCAAMDPTGRCKQCSCLFSIHMHIYYMTKTKEDRIIDDKVQKNINDKERVLQNAKKLISNISQRKSELEREHDIIVKCCARFAHFLQNNAITPFSDFYKEYIGYLITRERSLGVMANMATVQQLQKLLNEYEEAKISFDEALKLQKKLGESDVYITPQKIQDSIQDLYKLKHNGKKIKELYECQKKSRSKEHEYSEYIHKVVSTKSSDSKGAKKKDKENKNKSEKKHKEDKNKSEKKNKEDKSDKKKKDGDNQDTKKKPKPQRNVRYENQQPNQASRRPRTPPPPYAAPSQSHHPPYGAASYHQLPTPPMPPHVPGPHTPPAHDSYVPPYKANYGPKDEGASTYEFNISVNKKPNTGPSTNYYGDSYTQGSHPPPHSQYPPPHQGYQPPPNQYPGPPGSYQHEPYPPQHQAYPPHQENYYPQRGAYQPYRGAYQPHRGAYNPPRDPNVRPPHYGYPPSQGSNYYAARDRPQQHGSSENLRGNRGRGRGYRGGRGSGAYNKQKFKRDNQKKGNKKDDSDDSDSTSSSSSSSS